ncbi:MAG TPA: enoyl-CoA hydratase-related protein, partial [Burkholderiales bacterium]|nr:enoyl-CoA hydratase-related protein [Burkholderiales bacterium]
GGALVPLFMPPTLAKEYLMLARPFTAKDLANYGIVNHAVPASELDVTVDSIVSRLLRRSSYALAWTKRVANRLVASQLARTLDAGMAYEMINFLQRAESGSRNHQTLG